MNIIEQAYQSLKSWMDTAIALSSSDNSCDPPIELDADDLAVLAALQEAIKTQSESVGVVAEDEIVGPDVIEIVEWTNGKRPPVGTKLYTSAPTIPEGWPVKYKHLPSGEIFDEVIAAAYPEDIQPVVAIPKGWRLVPEEPTPEMIEAGHKNIDWCRDGQVTNVSVHPSQTEVVLDGEVIAHAGTTCADDVTDAYKAMLAAAPCQGEKP